MSQPAMDRRTAATELRRSQQQHQQHHLKHPSKCVRCECSIADDVHLTCAQCVGVHLCPACFAAGVEFKGHKKTHDYYVVDRVQCALYREDWKSNEELQLLHEVETHGLGNWEAVASRMPKRNADECKRHYAEVYLDAPTAPLPDTPPPQPAKRQPRRRAGGGNSKRSKTSQVNVQLGPEYAGFYPRRGDYEKECMANAEASLNDVVMYDDDEDVVSALKQGLLAGYRTRMATRVQRRKFADAYGLNDPEKVHEHTTAGKLRERCLFLRKFARYHTAEKHTALLEGLKRQEDLRRRVKELQALRHRGERTLPPRLREEAEDGEAVHAAGSGGRAGKQQERKRKTQEKTGKSKAALLETPADSSGSSQEQLRSLLRQEEIEFCEQNGVAFAVYLQTKKYLLVNNRIPNRTQLGGVQWKVFFSIQSFLDLQGWRSGNLNAADNGNGTGTGTGTTGPAPMTSTESTSLAAMQAGATAPGPSASTAAAVSSSASLPSANGGHASYAGVPPSASSSSAALSQLPPHPQPPALPPPPPRPQQQQQQRQHHEHDQPQTSSFASAGSAPGMPPVSTAMRLLPPHPPPP